MTGGPLTETGFYMSGDFYFFQSSELSPELCMNLASFTCAFMQEEGSWAAPFISDGDNDTCPLHSFLDPVNTSTYTWDHVAKFVSLLDITGMGIVAQRGCVTFPKPRSQQVAEWGTHLPSLNSTT